MGTKVCTSAFGSTVSKLRISTNVVVMIFDFGILIAVMNQTTENKTRANEVEFITLVLFFYFVRF